MQETDQFHRLGWRPDLPDFRDITYAAKHEIIGHLPAAVDLRDQCPPVYDQSALGSCTANAIGACFEFDLLKQGLKDFMPSRLFIYYNERVKERTVNSDAGAQIRDGIKSIAAQGVCPETLWPYDIGMFRNRPTEECYTQALRHRCISYTRISRDIDHMRDCLASGFPFTFGFSVYDSMESNEVARTGVVPMPSRSESLLGGHAVAAVGYDHAQQVFIVRNSWGASWGQDGYFTLPYGYFTNRRLSSDFWSLKAIGCNE